MTGLSMPTTDFSVGDWAAPVEDLRIDGEDWPRKIVEVVPDNPYRGIGPHVVFDNGIPIRLHVLVHCDDPNT